MDWLTFFSSLISSVAWPVMIGTVCIVFRKDLMGIANALIPRVEEFKWKEWSVKLKAIESTVSHEILPKSDNGKITIEGNAKLHEDSDSASASGSTKNLHDRLDEEFEKRVSKLMEVASVSPQAAIILAWKDLNQALKKVGTSESLYKSNDELKEDMPWMLETINELRKIRNAIVHDSSNVTEFKIDTAENYIRNAEIIAITLDPIDGTGKRI